VGLAVDKTNSRLYVASSDFDLQFNGGSVQVLDLERIRSLVPRECQNDEQCNQEAGEVCDSAGDAPTFFCVAKLGDDPCGNLGVQTEAKRLLVPGRCGYVDLLKPVDGGSPLLVGSVGTGAFATDIQLRYGPYGDNGRLFLPVRGEASLHWIDLESDGSMSCGQTEDSPKCDKAHRIGTDEDENERNVKMPAEPYGLAINDEGDAIVVTHQTTGKASLFHQDISSKEAWEAGPSLEFVQTNLPTQVLAIASAPSPQLVRDARVDWLNADNSDGLVSDPYPPGFLVAYRNAARIDLLRFYADRESSPTRPFLQLATSVAITANSVGSDTRGIAYDDFERRDCEASCPAKDSADNDKRTSCLADCAKMPIGVYVASRSPASLLIGSTVKDTWATQNRDVPKFFDAVPLPTGASRVYVSKVVGSDGSLETRVFVVCFDQRRIAIYDPIRRRMEGFVTTGRGPHALAFDYAPADANAGTPARALAYVAHFTDSYVSVIELDQRKFRTYSNIVLNLGPDNAPRASK
jgi:DNA-binding beta-propeller fold protein YncE